MKTKNALITLALISVINLNALFGQKVFSETYNSYEDTPVEVVFRYNQNELTHTEVNQPEEGVDHKLVIKMSDASVSSSSFKTDNGRKMTVAPKLSLTSQLLRAAGPIQRHYKNTYTL